MDLAFSVTSGVDSRTIIDMNGAEKLLGKGDMLFYPSGYQKPVRVQGAFVSDKEVQKVVDYLIDKNGNANYDEEVVNHVIHPILAWYLQTDQVPMKVMGEMPIL